MKHFVATITLIALSALVDIGHAQKLGNDKTLEVLTWNLEWFGSTSKGPKDNNKQMQIAAKVLDDLGPVDVIVFEEICDSKLFKRLADTAGYNFYLSPGSDAQQKIGVFYLKNLQVKKQPTQILLEHKGTFAQRPPVSFTFEHPDVGEVTVIGLHLKAQTGRSTPAEKLDSYERRKKSAVILQNYINSTLGSKKVAVLGDWNDALDVSNYEKKETPFKSIIEDKSLRFVTYYLSFAFIESSKHGSVIDHICITDALFGNFRSAAVVGVKDKIKKYIEECSDHYPMYSVFEGNDDYKRRKKENESGGAKMGIVAVHDESPDKNSVVRESSYESVMITGLIVFGCLGAILAYLLFLYNLRTKENEDRRYWRLVVMMEEWMRKNNRYD